MKRIILFIVISGILVAGFYWGYQVSKAKKSLQATSSDKSKTAEQAPLFDQSTTLLISVNTTTLLFAIDSIQTSLSVKPSLENDALPVVINLQLYLIESTKTFMFPKVSSLADQSFTMEMTQVNPGKGKTGRGISGTAHVVSDEQIELKVNYYVY